MTNLTDRIKLAQAAAIDHENKMIEESMRAGELEAKRCEAAAKLLLADLNLEVDLDHLECAEPRHARDADERPWGDYILNIYIGETCTQVKQALLANDEYIPRCVTIHFNVSFTQSVPQQQTVYVTSENGLKEFYGADSKSTRQFDTFDEALVFATEGYEEPAPEHIVKMERLIKVWRDLRAELLPDWPGVTVSITIPNNNAEAIRAAQAFGFEKYVANYESGCDWNLVEETEPYGSHYNRIHVDDTSLLAKHKVNIPQLVTEDAQ